MVMIVNEVYTVQITYWGVNHSKKICDLDRAVQWAEEAVYDLGAEYSCVEDVDGDIYCEYEL